MNVKNNAEARNTSMCFFNSLHFEIGLWEIYGLHLVGIMIYC